jgi:hypothetical protein
MFQASSCPSSGATTAAVAASGLPSDLDDSSAVGRGRAGWPDHDQQHCYHQALTVNQRLLLQLLWPTGRTTTNSTAITKLRR